MTWINYDRRVSAYTRKDDLVKQKAARAQAFCPTDVVFTAIEENINISIIP